MIERRVLVPPQNIDYPPGPGPYIFLNGPIQGAPDW